MSASETSEFGKDHGLIHEVVVTGRKVGAGATFWSRLAHNVELFGSVVKMVMGMIVPTCPFDPVQFVGKKWSLISEDRDERSATLSEVDFSTVLFETCLKETEMSIKGEEKLARLKAGKNVRLGATVFMGLWKDYEERKEDSVLERLYKEKEITYLDFFGDVLLGPGGRRCVLCLYRADGGVWYWFYYWLDRAWDGGNRSASLASENLGLEVHPS